MSLSDDKQADIIDAFGATSGYLDDILNINNVYFNHVVSRMCTSELIPLITKPRFYTCICQLINDIVSNKIYDKRETTCDVPRSTSYGIYISQLVRFARASSHVADFNTRNKLLTHKLLKQGY